MHDIARGQIPSLRTAATGQPSTWSALRWRKIARRVPLALAWALLILGLGLLGLRLAGYQYIYTRGDSMEPTVSAGSLLLARTAAPEDIRAGDIIAFPGTSKGTPSVLHRVVALVDDGNRMIAFTQGDNNPVLDPDPLTLDRPFQRVVLIVPYLGWWVTPALVWHLLGISALLWVRIALRWRAQRKTKNPTKVPRHIGTKDDAVVCEQY